MRARSVPASTMLRPHRICGKRDHLQRPDRPPARVVSGGGRVDRGAPPGPIDERSRARWGRGDLRPSYGAAPGPIDGRRRAEWSCLPRPSNGAAPGADRCREGASHTVPVLSSIRRSRCGTRSRADPGARCSAVGAGHSSSARRWPCARGAARSGTDRLTAGPSPRTGGGVARRRCAGRSRRAVRRVPPDGPRRDASPRR